MRNNSGPWLSLLLILTTACNRPAAGPIQAVPARQPWFEDITERVGLDFRHDAGPVDDKYFLPQVMGSGAALFDYDNDGRLDILLLQNGGPHSAATHRLFHQQADGKFRDVSQGSGLDGNGHGMGVAVGDVNNDGYPDVVMTFYRGVRLFLNHGGNGTFTPASKDCGLDGLGWGTSAAFLDFDRDGWLDLVVTNYVDYDPAARCADAAGRPQFCHPGTFHGSVTNLYRNLGILNNRPGSGNRQPLTPTAGPSPLSPRFEDVTLRSGLGRKPGPGLGVLCADFDGDGWPDILIANDDKPNHLWMNQRDGTFREEALVRGIAVNAAGRNQANMGVAFGDVDGDGRFDVFITHLTEETHALWGQRAAGVFSDRTAAAGLLSPRWRGTGFGTVLGDFDHDGWPDLAVVNGRVSRGPRAGNPELGEFWDEYGERNQLFANDGSGKFHDISLDNPDFSGTAWVSRGLAVGDVDGDGALDLLVTCIGTAARLYRNVAPRRGHWLLVRAFEPQGKRDAYGAIITVEAGGRRHLGYVNPGHSYLCSNDPRAHFGLGAASTVDSLQVAWPDGTVEDFPGGPANRLVVVRKGEGRRRTK